MCEIFIRASEVLCAGNVRCACGVATSLRLEQLFWQVLEEIAGRDGMRVTQLIERLYDELIEYRGQAANFTSFLRVCCLRYQLLQAEGRIPLDAAVPSRSLNARPCWRACPPRSMTRSRCPPGDARPDPDAKKGPIPDRARFRLWRLRRPQPPGWSLRQRDFALHDAADAYASPMRELAL